MPMVRQSIVPNPLNFPLTHLQLSRRVDHEDKSIIIPHPDACLNRRRLPIVPACNSQFRKVCGCTSIQILIQVTLKS